MLVIVAILTLVAAILGAICACCRRQTVKLGQAMVQQSNSTRPVQTTTTRLERPSLNQTVPISVITTSSSTYRPRGANGRQLNPNCQALIDCLNLDLISSRTPPPPYVYFVADYDQAWATQRQQQLQRRHSHENLQTQNLSQRQNSQSHSLGQGQNLTRGQGQSAAQAQGQILSQSLTQSQVSQISLIQAQSPNQTNNRDGPRSPHTTYDMYPPHPNSVLQHYQQQNSLSENGALGSDRPSILSPPPVYEELADDTSTVITVDGRRASTACSPCLAEHCASPPPAYELCVANSEIAPVVITASDNQNRSQCLSV